MMHYFTVLALNRRWFPKVSIDQKGMDLTITYGEYQFLNPLGNGAGVDKIGKALDGLANLGFGFIELGEFTSEYQAWSNRPKYVDCYQKAMPDSKGLIWKNIY